MEIVDCAEEAGITVKTEVKNRKKKEEKNEGNAQRLGKEDPRNGIEAKLRRAE